MTNAVTETYPHSFEKSIEYFFQQLAFETDCWDVHEAMKSENPGFVLLDVRSSKLYQESHVPGALNLPHREINETSLASYPQDTLFVVYCAGPHCNGATKAALRLSNLKRPVKLMIGGMTGWIDEKFPLDSSK